MLALVCCAAVLAQVRAPPLRGLIAEIHGTVKQITKNSILLEGDDGRIHTIRLSKKTKFAEVGKPSKPGNIGVETAVTIEMTEDADAKFTAVLVNADAVQKLKGPKERRE
jgi:hypothetical protein